VLAPRLRINRAQAAALPAFAPEGGLDPAIADLIPVRTDAPRLIAPGLVALPTPGHTAGSLSFFLKLADGREILLVGDIVWAMSNLDTLKTRPRLLQYMMFDPQEDRPKVLAQVRALHDLRNAEPDIAIVPSHDLENLKGLMDGGWIEEGFALK
jgi:glyoxylase-like metal-dependent hydrolase (beta-lactamase superfamily II)